MSRRISFSKYTGCGNDFILIDNREGVFPSGESSLIQDLCHRNLGIGADGLILLDQNEKGLFRMRIYNADGGEAEMCGNGLRCFGRFLQELGIPGERYDVEVSGVVYPVSIEAEGVSVVMAPPNKILWMQKLAVGDNEYVVDYLNTGVPHIVQFVDDVDEVPLREVAPSLRYHPAFSPQGANVDIASVMNSNIIRMRTYERGVEDETLACGTGATAVAIAAAKRYGLSSPITIKTRSGENLVFHITGSPDKLEKITMMGPAKQVYSGIAEV